MVSRSAGRSRAKGAKGTKGSRNGVVDKDAERTDEWKEIENGFRDGGDNEKNTEMDYAEIKTESDKIENESDRVDKIENQEETDKLDRNLSDEVNEGPTEHEHENQYDTESDIDMNRDLRHTEVDGKSSKGRAPARKRPTFVEKLWKMVNDDKHSDLIRWMPDGQSFEVWGTDQFEQEVLPQYYKHSKFTSFVRQLNIYGWRKVQDSIQSPEDLWRFESPHFIRGREDLLVNIVRSHSSKDAGSGENDNVDMAHILKDLSAIKSDQQAIAKNLGRISNDNRVLWNEHVKFREKHSNHSDTLERILRFLASLYGSDARNKLLADGTVPSKEEHAAVVGSDAPPRLILQDAQQEIIENRVVKHSAKREEEFLKDAGSIKQSKSETIMDTLENEVGISTSDIAGSPKRRASSMALTKRSQALPELPVATLESKSLTVQSPSSTLNPALLARALGSQVANLEDVMAVISSYQRQLGSPSDAQPDVQLSKSPDLNFSDFLNDPFDLADAVPESITVGDEAVKKRRVG